MKTAFKSLLAACVLSTLSFSAHADRDVKSRILNMSNNIVQSIATTQASDDQLQQALDLLAQANDLLNSTTGPSPTTGDCFKIAYDAYFQQQYAGQATDSAIAACKTVADTGVLSFLYQVYFQQKYAVDAMNAAAKGSGRSSRGKLDIIKFAYDKYFQQKYASDAADLAVAGAAKVRPNSLTCLTELYNTYFQQYYAVDAMNKAFDGCAQMR